MSVITPRESQTDLLDGVNGHPVPISQTGVRLTASPDFHNITPVKLGPVPTTCVHRSGDRLQVLGVDATFDPAEVVKLQTIGNCANELVVRNYMGVDGSAVKADLPVVRIAGVTTDPDPAGSWVTALLDEVVALCDRGALTATATKSYSGQRVTSLVEVARKGLADYDSAGPSFYLDATSKEVTRWL